MIRLFYTETLSFREFCRLLTTWQLLVRALTKISAKWGHFRFSARSPSFPCKNPLLMMDVAVRDRKTAVHGRIQVINGAQVDLENCKFKWRRIACSISNKSVGIDGAGCIAWYTSKHGDMALLFTISPSWYSAISAIVYMIQLSVL